MSLALRNLLFTIVVPGAGAVYAPWWILTRNNTSPRPVAWYAIVVIALGVALYFWCLWVFATVGRGTPGPWDAPRRFVAAGPYQWVRNPMYIAALLVVVGETWLFLSVTLTVYAVVLAIGFHLSWSGMKSQRSARSLTMNTTIIRNNVSRWIPRPP